MRHLSYQRNRCANHSLSYSVCRKVKKGLRWGIMTLQKYDSGHHSTHHSTHDHCFNSLIYESIRMRRRLIGRSSPSKTPESHIILKTQKKPQKNAASVMLRGPLSKHSKNLQKHVTMVQYYSHFTLVYVLYRRSYHTHTIHNCYCIHIYYKHIYCYIYIIYIHHKLLLITLLLYILVSYHIPTVGSHVSLGPIAFDQARSGCQRRCRCCQQPRGTASRRRYV